MGIGAGEAKRLMHEQPMLTEIECGRGHRDEMETRKKTMDGRESQHEIPGRRNRQNSGLAVLEIWREKHHPTMQHCKRVKCSEEGKN